MGNQIGEVRGILPQQNIEPQLQEILDKKLQDFGEEAERFQKKSEDMKHLTSLVQKQENGEQFTKEDLTFLYEIDSDIEGFGYEKDPRIEELRSQRNKEEDMLIIFECVKEQIAHDSSEINEGTKAYVGEWNPTVFQFVKQYPNTQYLYESFPEKKIFIFNLETDPSINSPEKAEEKLKEKNIYITDWAKDILHKTEFSEKGEIYELVQFTVEQLGFPNGATTDEIYTKAKEIGLSLCPAEVVPHLRLVYKGKDWKRIAMNQIPDHDGDPHVFDLRAAGAGLELGGSRARSGDGLFPDTRFVFLSRD